MITRFLSAVLLTLLGLGIVPAYGDTHSVRPTAGSLSPANGAVLRAAALRLAHAPPAHVLIWLRHDGSVQSAALGKDGRTLAIRFRNGSHALILPAAIGTVRVSLASAPRPARQSAEPRVPTATPRALVLEPFATELQIGSSAGAVEVADLQSAGYQVDQAQDTAVTLATMATLPQYNVVYMHTHSGADPSGEGVVATGELAGGDPAVGPLLADGSVTVVGVAGSSQQYYAITSRYIALHEDRFAANSLLFINGCSLLQGTAFWQALRSRGVGVLVSWDNDSTATDNFLSAAAFFAEMNQGMSVQGALAALKAAGYGTSTYKGKTATMEYLGDGSITLQSAKQPVGSGGPPTATLTATPLPTATSTMVPSTPTSSPNAPPSPTVTTTLPPPTHTPPPVLGVAFKRLVRPGTRQAITIHSTAGAQVRALVVYPNGERTSLASRVDATGTARIAYVQPSSTITRTQRRAAVTIEITSAGSTAIRTVMYRIAWSQVDVVLEPPTQAPGGSVVVWVHTRSSRSAVNLVVRRGSSRQSARHSGRTGSAGWLHWRYRLSTHLRAGQILVVQAAAHVADRLFRTHTSLPVR